MKFTSKTFLNIGGFAYLLLGIGHMSYELFLTDSAADLKLRSFLDSYDFSIFDNSLSLYQFHTGYSIMMATQDLLIGALCLTMRNPGRSSLLILMVAGLITPVLVRNFFTGGPPLYLSIIAAAAFILAFWKSFHVTKREAL
ncbi:LIC_13387 family protein [Chitinophaga barathri]|uniref:Uncharacterized protein n=1 Tax=Chitinophaga barathri TaxID=1647451 RepID=A0A3N4MD84_9BACT|nr:hypothetical protein [Chitinophaga barathri]RPD41528.1 hypothetical protein EG028_09460 [Chitinophaga barathri]